MNKSNTQTQSGFTITELLIVMGIIALLAIMAIPQYSSYRKRTYESQVKTDLKNAATAEEAYFTKNSGYKGGVLTDTTLPGFSKTPDVNLSATVGTDTFVLSASHVNCGSSTWTFDSTTGQISSASGCP